MLGLNHEQQHQELLVTDLKHIFSSNPLLPAYGGAPRGSEDDADEQATRGELPSAQWLAFDSGVYHIGTDADTFSFDNERPRHRVFLEPFAIASRPVSNGEYLRFVEDGGYDRPELWLDLGYQTIKQEGWCQPIYWYRDGGRWMQYTMDGPRPLAMDEPVCHLSYF